MKQLSFLPKLKISISLAHGGDIRTGKRKIKRPFDPKRPLHVVFRSSRAHGEWSMLRPQNRDAVQRAVDRLADFYSIRVYRFANVGNHLHLLVSAPSQKALQAFLRRLPAEIAIKVTRASKSNPVGRFWDKLVYTRVVSWGREFERVMKYLVKNLFEAAGLWNRKKYPDAVILSMPTGG